MHSLSKILPLLALSGALASAPLASGVQVTFTNSTGLSSDDVYVWFNGDSSSLDATFGNNPSQSVSTVKSYSLTEIGSQGIDISSYSAGQIFVTLGMPFSTDVNQITQPSPSNPGLNSYDTMFQLLMEINVTPGSTFDTVDLSNKDYASVPANISNYNNTQGLLKTIGFSNYPGFSSSSYAQALSNLTGGSAVQQASTYNNSLPPTSYTQAGSPVVHNTILPGAGQDVRILGPDQVSGYPSFSNYITSIINNNPSPSEAAPIARLKGKFFASSPSEQGIYDCKVTGIEQSGSDPAGSLGKVTIEGTFTPDDGEPVTVTIVIPADQFNDGNIYGANPTFTVNGVTHTISDNDAYAAVVRDFLAGLSYGYIDSDIPNPNDPGKNYGESESQYWGSTNLITLAKQVFKGFDEVQTEEEFYNVWAALVHEYSDGSVYGSAFDDAFAAVQLGVEKETVDGTTYDVDRLDIEILPGLYNVPEPATYAAIMAVLTFGLAVIVRRRRQRNE